MIPVEKELSSEVMKKTGAATMTKSGKKYQEYQEDAYEESVTCAGDTEK